MPGTIRGGVQIVPQRHDNAIEPNPRCVRVISWLGLHGSRRIDGATAALRGDTIGNRTSLSVESPLEVFLLLSQFVQTGLLPVRIRPPVGHQGLCIIGAHALEQFGNPAVVKLYLIL